MRLSKAAESLPLLAAGLNDKVITHQGDVSKTTLNRRIADSYRPSTPAPVSQLGWRAALSAFPEHAPREDGNGSGEATG